MSKNKLWRSHNAYIRALKRDPCVYCGARAENFDHIEPQSLGGTNRWDNIAPVCGACNSSKGTGTVLGTMLRLALAHENRAVVQGLQHVCAAATRVRAHRSPVTRRATLDCQRPAQLDSPTQHALPAAAKATLDTSTHHDRTQLLRDLLTHPRHAWPTLRGQNQ